MVLTLSNPDSQVTKRSKHRKTFKDKVTHVVEELKKTNSSLFFALNGVLDTEMLKGGGVGGFWFPWDPPLDPPLRAECGELILFVFFPLIFSY